jgi:HAD superfamily hydrolase (TIGR01549 family)
MKKIIIYDCDGVLFDSKDAVLAYYDYVCEKFGLTKIDRSNLDLVNKAMMRTNDEIINLLTDNKKLVNEILEFAKKMNFQKFLNYMIPEVGIFETLDRLQKQDYIKTIFTNRGHSLHYLLKYFDMEQYFQYKLTSFDVENNKPHPEGIFKTIDYFNAKKEDVIYIGDSENDYYAALSAGVDFVAFKNSLGDSPVIYNHLDIFKYL